MANQGAKKRKEENKQHMANLLRLIITCNVIYVLVRMFIFYSTFTWKHWVGLFVTSVVYGLPYKQLSNMAKPTYSDNGELLDGGFDMTSSGVCGYLHDVIYITSFVQIMSNLSGKFWWIYLVIPAFAVYKASGLIMGFLSQRSEGDVEDEKTRRKREKMERKASRGKFIKTRNSVFWISRGMGDSLIGLISCPTQHLGCLISLGIKHTIAMTEGIKVLPSLDVPGSVSTVKTSTVIQDDLILQGV